MRGIDSNILIYAYDADEGQKHHDARDLVNKIWKGEIVGVVTAQTLGEFFNIATRKIERPISAAAAIAIVQDIILSPSIKVVSYSHETILRAMQTTSSTRRFWDTLIAATLLENGIDTIYTEDVADFEGTGITAVNPLGG